MYAQFMAFKLHVSAQWKEIEDHQKATHTHTHKQRGDSATHRTTVPLK